MAFMGWTHCIFLILKSTNEEDDKKQSKMYFIFTFSIFILLFLQIIYNRYKICKHENHADSL